MLKKIGCHIALIFLLCPLAWAQDANTQAHKTTHSQPSAITKSHMVSANNHLGITHAQQRVILKHGQQSFTVTLPANPSTGYVWFLLQYNTHFFAPEKYQYTASKPQRMGSGGIAHFTFKVEDDFEAVPQISDLHFVYMRPNANITHNSTFKTVHVVSTGQD